ncbi:family 20 glycosylhydrolase [Thalassotalea fonticola]|uniref:beta-N-acetylhexosaminidase n=1 Tax=Thalassotalea fonticola TaxID=3065649 RepID=A0ABZ0GL64_9GAMM|nr:family 20 glycosylhydrolase [Colwelliaceae bacterium S1-1]
MIKIVLSLLVGVLCCSAQADSNSNSEIYAPMADIKNLRSAKAALIPYPENIRWGNRTYQGNHITEVIKPLHFSESEEAYKLSINEHGIKIHANHQRGLFYAKVTLKQLVGENETSYPFVEIEDAPAYKIRGVMHDVGRNFQSIAALKEQLVHLSRYKLNTFHWHLSDHPGWRIESIKYPQLNDKANYRQSRAPGSFYSYAEIIELIEFANQLNINVIPELDMPGHSQFFTNTFGFTMGSEQGRKICLDLLQEFFEQVPRSLAPIIHLGADEVKIKDPEVFIQLMVDKIESQGRTAVVWAPGLAPLSKTISHTWKGQNHYPERQTLDSVDLYTNKMDPFNTLNQVYFKRINGKYSADKTVSLGGIIATWNDVNVDDESEILRNNPFYTSALTGAEVLWKGNKTGSNQYQFQFPPVGSVEHTMLAEFEQRLLLHKRRYFYDNDEIFFYRPQANAQWQVRLNNNANSKPGNDANKISNSEQLYGGNTLVFKTRQSRGNISAGYFQDVAVGTKLSATRVIHSDSAKKVKLFVGINMPERSHRMWQGVPEQGQWDAFGSTVSLNGKSLAPPTWRKPGNLKIFRSVWRSPIKEEPWSTEDLYWLRDPVIVELKAGNNELKINSQLGYKHQVWQVSAWIDEI